jgi:hypothetical protein
MKDYIALNRLTKGQNIPRPPFGDAVLVYDFDGALKLIDGDTVSKVGMVPEPPADAGMVNRSNGKWVKPLGTPTVITTLSDPSFLRVFYGNIPPSLRPTDGITTGTAFIVFIGSSAEVIGQDAFVYLTFSSQPRIYQLTISEGVTTIGNGAFRNNNLTSVVIPNSVTTMKGYAFDNNALTSVVIGDSVTNIEHSTFNNNNLTSVVIPNSVIFIGSTAFYNNDLTSVVIPNSVTSIGDYAFGYNSLTSVVIGDGVTQIGLAAFQNNSLTSVVIPNSVTSIGPAAFRSNSLTSVVIGDGVTSIAYGVFMHNSLTSVVIPNSVTSIGASAFQNNSLTSVVIGDGVTSIGDYAFCDNDLTSVNLPYGLKTIGAQAFVGNPLLADIYCLAEKSVLIYGPASEAAPGMFQTDPLGSNFFIPFYGIVGANESFSYPSFGSTGAIGVQRIHVAVNDDTWTAGPLTMSGGNTILVIKDLPPIPLPRPVEVPSGSGSGSGSSGSGVGVGLI